MKTITALWQALALIAAISLACTNARAADNYPEWHHANRVRGCEILDAVIPGFADPAHCQEAITLMEIGPEIKAFESCLFSVSNAVKAHTLRDSILVGCSMLSSGMGEETTRRLIQQTMH